jgi:hypothetical protein
MTSVSGLYAPTTYNGVPDGGTVPVGGGWTAPTGRPAVGSQLIDAAGRVVGTLTGYTFNGMPQHSFADNVSIDQAAAATRNPAYR